MRAGFGLDVHAFGGEPPVVLAGVVADPARGLAGHSDADVVAHAVMDALLGAAGLGDIGMRFPSDDAQWSGADSMELLRRVVNEVSEAGFRPVHVDVTIVAQNVRVSPIRSEIAAALSNSLGASVNVKATTTDHLGALGRDEGVAAHAVATLSYDS